VFRPKGKFVSEGRGIDVRPKGRMLGDILHTLPVVIDHMAKVFETPDIVLFGNDSFHFFSFR
jgi:ADP-heptose:LPS heptosyltransferase